MFEYGTWRKNEEAIGIVRSCLKRAEKLKVYYYDIGSLTPVEIFSLIRRFYLNKVGRGNRFIVHYDYIKPFMLNSNTPEYKEMGHFIHQIKTMINNEIPCSFWASLQLNRSGITNNKAAKDVDDSENSFSISDRIIQQTTHSWLIRPKLMDEIAKEDNRFGNLMMMCVKHRHLGKDYKAALNPVKIGASFKRNYINLNVNSFFFEDRGDLSSIASYLEGKLDVSEDNKDDEKLV
jgi:hypothetical protein